MSNQTLATTKAVHALEKSLTGRAHEGFKFRKSPNYPNNPITYYIVREVLRETQRRGDDNGEHRRGVFVFIDLLSNILFIYS